MHFTKMEGLGNDYVYLDCTRSSPTPDLPALSRRMSDRHFGVGSDGLICIFPSRIADFQMVMFNADGSQAEMCGNGIRCVGKFVYDKGLTPKTQLTVETLAGVKHLTLSVNNGAVDAVTVDMGRPELQEMCTLSVGDRLYQGVPVSVGNPHFVCPTVGVKDYPVTEIGPLLECHPHFPNRTNVEFAEVLDAHRIRMRVWERGSGETLACGTGACATLCACAQLGLTQRDGVIELCGGELHIRWDETDGHLYMTGPARTAFEGDWPDGTAV